MDRAARLSGARFGFMIGDTALVALALYRYAIDVVSQAGFLPVLPPVLVREEAMYGTGFFPTDRSNIYAVESDNLYLTGTSEVALAGMHMGEILEERAAVLRRATRRTSGARPEPRARTRAGCSACTSSTKSRCSSTASPRHLGRRARADPCDRGADPAGSRHPVPRRQRRRRRPRRTRREEVRLRRLVPGSQERYRELTSTSNTTDFQARRLGIRYRDGKNVSTPHTLNGTAITDRALLAMLENFQGDVPDVLHPYGAPATVSR